MNKNSLGAILIACSFVLSPFSFAKSHSKPTSTPCGGAEVKMLVEKLALDTKQQANVCDIKSQLRANMQSNWENLRTVHMQINQEVMSDKMNETKLDVLIDAKVQLFTAMMKARAMSDHQIYTSLNAEQKTKFQAMIKQQEEKWGRAPQH